MDHVVRIKPGGDQLSELAIHPEKAAALNLETRKFACLSFGSQKHYVKIRISPEISQDILLLSENTIEQLLLPGYPVYEICSNQKEIIIGPYIGLLLSNSDRRLTVKRLQKILIYVREYAKLHGAVVVFALNKVDRNNRRIEGYCYNPVQKCWQKGIFPYPAAIYRTIGLSMEWKNHFLSVIGDKIFNNRFFNKWEMYQWFSKEPAVNRHLPYTELYRSPQDVFAMLDRFPQIYLKPVFGLQGRGIFKICRENRKLLFKYREKKENHQLSFETAAESETFLSKQIRPGRFLIQQAIDLLEHKGKLIDFRCILQKNQANAWVCQAIIGRSGVKDSIVSNISSGGLAFPAHYLLEKLSLPEESSALLRAKMTELAITVCNKLDEFGINCGTLGLDIGIDQQRQLWLIEINNRDPDPGIALDAHDLDLYHTLKSGPLYYAKFLAGFK